MPVQQLRPELVHERGDERFDLRVAAGDDPAVDAAMMVRVVGTGVGAKIHAVRGALFVAYETSLPKEKGAKSRITRERSET